MLHIIDPNICIDCSACGMVCPVEAIRDQFGEVCKFIRRPTHRPVAVIYEELCSGCDFCVDIEVSLRIFRGNAQAKTLR